MHKKIYRCLVHHVYDEPFIMPNDSGTSILNEIECLGVHLLTLRLTLIRTYAVHKRAAIKEVCCNLLHCTLSSLVKV